MRVLPVANRILASVAIATLAALISVQSASAAVIPDPGDPVGTPTIVQEDSGPCPLRRVGTHLARCDVLTGGGVATAATPALEPGNADLFSDGLNCPLRRVGRHLVRCDYLTGHADAPLFVPEV